MGHHFAPEQMEGLRRALEQAHESKMAALHQKELEIENHLEMREKVGTGGE